MKNVCLLAIWAIQEPEVLFVWESIGTHKSFLNEFSCFQMYFRADPTLFFLCSMISVLKGEKKLNRNLSDMENTENLPLHFYSFIKIYWYFFKWFVILSEVSVCKTNFCHIDIFSKINSSKLFSVFILWILLSVA